MYRYVSYSPDETYRLASCLGQRLQGGELIALEGELGAGKTHFVKGLAAGLGSEEPVTSPTFTLIHMYEGRLPLAHFDVYRLPCPESLEELGYEEFFYGQGITAVEWSDLIIPYLPSQYLQVELRRDFDEGNNERRIITFKPHGASFEKLLEELEKDDSSRD